MIFIKEGGGEYGGYVFKFYIGVIGIVGQNRTNNIVVIYITRYCVLESLSL